MGDNGYALNLLSPVRHVATEMERAAPAALSVADMAAGYQHSIPGDLSRVRQHEHCATDEEAGVWLIKHAVEALTFRGKTGQRQVEQVDGGYRLTVPFEDLRYDRHKLHRARHDHDQFGDPFNPMSGRWSDNVRSSLGNLDELRDSMREFGWIKELPAIKDEHGVVLVGHRRLKVAEELGVTPVEVIVKCGDGDGGDARRLKLALASNIGFKPFTPNERKDLAEYLYGEREWTMESIGKALGVTHKTISKDLDGFVPTVQTSRPKGGRPRKSKKATPELEQEVHSRVEAGEPVPRRELAEKHGVGQTTIEMAHQRAIGAAEARQQAAVRTPHCPTCTCQ
jgi:hypothetical protein